MLLTSLDDLIVVRTRGFPTVSVNDCSVLLGVSCVFVMASVFAVKSLSSFAVVPFGQDAAEGGGDWKACLEEARNTSLHEMSEALALSTRFMSFLIRNTVLRSRPARQPEQCADGERQGRREESACA